MSNSLLKPHRKQLENITAAARVLAEAASRAALENLAVHEREYRAHMTVEQRLLRNRLRAKGRALGDQRDARTGTQAIKHLVEQTGYAHWHRLLFTRFLTENHLLITDDAHSSVPITLEECEELAPELGARDGLDLACRFASLTLPGVFRRDDPVLELSLALNDQVELRKLLAALPADCFRADDALGWTYQFWQAQRKEEVNKSGKKIGADELSPVTQLFTEDYMVEFLLHNTLGAWWAGRQSSEQLSVISCPTEDDARRAVSLPARDGVPGITWAYLRFILDEATQTWRPAAGTFDGWPTNAAAIRLLDPCMGSGHFLVFALPLLVRLRMEEEGLSARAAVTAVLQDNLHGLELDERCTQIAAFNVALTAWKLAGYQPLPPLHLACSGLAPTASEAEWIALAGTDSRARNGMARLHRLFADAPVLGSLINPRALGGDLLEADFHELAPLLTAALAQTEGQPAKFENDAAEQAVIAQGLAKAAELLAEQFTLVMTNVPYLGRGKQESVIKEYCERVYFESKNDLATCFVERCLEFCTVNSSTALVTPQNWWFSSSYRGLRKSLLTNMTFRAIASLGEEAWQSFGDRGPLAALMVINRTSLANESKLFGIDALGEPTIEDKTEKLVGGLILTLTQIDLYRNPDHLIAIAKATEGSLLKDYANSTQGIKTGDDELFSRNFWEIKDLNQLWRFYQGSVSNDCLNGGLENLLLWKDNGDSLARRQGLSAWDKQGILVGLMRSIPVTRYFGFPFASSVSPITVKDEKNYLAIWCFCSSKQFRQEVRKIDKRVCVSNNSLLNVPFDLTHWQAVAAEKYPNGLPKPHSDDPTQWLFNGHPKDSEQPLHVAVARLLGYRWPRQTGSSFPDCPALDPDGLKPYADEDGIVCLPPLNREQPAAARLRQLLTAALGPFDERALIAAAGLKGSKSKTLEDWLRDEFFEQHCKLFHDRPFIWHIWDGRADGFHALVNYHRLDHANLQKLTYSALGDWIRQQSDDAKADKPGAAERLGAAQKLQAKLAALLEGEAPLDIFVRWKALKEQAIGWHPDLNDGVRQNIRPFLFAEAVGKKGAGLFRVTPLKLADKDRGTEPERPKSDYPWFWCEEEPDTDPVGGKEFVGTRWNNAHLTLARKQKARA